MTWFPLAGPASNHPGMLSSVLCHRRRKITLVWAYRTLSLCIQLWTLNLHPGLVVVRFPTCELIESVCFSPCASLKLLLFPEMTMKSESKKKKAGKVSRDKPRVGLPYPYSKSNISMVLAYTGIWYIDTGVGRGRWLYLVNCLKAHDYEQLEGSACRPYIFVFFSGSQINGL